MKLALFSSLSIIFLLICSAIIIASHQSKDFTISDFRAQYTGANLALQGKYDQLYDLDSQFTLQKKLFPKLIYVQLLPFFSPPLIASFLTPLALFDFKTAYLVFCLFLTLILISTGVIFLKQTKIAKKNKQLFNLDRYDTLLLLSSLFPFWMNILNTQLSLIWVLIFFLFIFFGSRKSILKQV